MIEDLEKNIRCEEEDAENRYANRDCDIYHQFQSTKNPTTRLKTQKKTITKPMKIKVKKPMQKLMSNLERDFENMSIQKNSNLRHKNNVKHPNKKKLLLKPHTLSDLGKKFEKVDLNEKKSEKIDQHPKKLEDLEICLEKLSMERQFSRRFSATLQMENTFSGELWEDWPIALNAEVYHEDSVNNL